MQRITDPLAHHAAQRPRGLAAVDGQRRLDWAGLAAAVAERAAALAAQGLVAGQRVALIAADGVDALVCALAVLQAGGVHVPLDHRLTPGAIQTALDELQVPWRIDDPVAGGLIASGVVGAPEALAAESSAFLRCSSGTTGEAKGVLLSHRSIIERCAAANRLLGLGAEDRVLWLLPMAYHFAVSIGLYLQLGAAVVFGAALRASRSAAIAREQACTALYASPYHIRRLAELPPGQDLPPSLRLAVATTAALDPETATAFRERHGLGVRQGLGIIEVGLPLCSPGAVGEAPGYLGRPGSDHQLRVVDEAGRELPVGEAGELELRGPGLFDAYTRPWTPREQALRPGGWFASGDLARIDAAGGVTLLGRRKTLINVGGLKVFPLEVEAVLAAHPQVAACRVVAEPDPRTGEAVVAEIEATAAEPGPLLAALEAWCAERLAPLARPVRYRLVATLPRTPSGKVKRRDREALPPR